MKRNLVALCVLLFVLWSTTFVYVQNPIGLVPEGATVWMFKPDRLLTNIPFICSTDGMSNQAEVGINVFTRMAAMLIVVKSGYKIVRLPYSETLYKISL